MCRRDPSAEVEMARMMERERQEGRDLLEQMVTKGDQIDWAAVIAKAHELHAKEQAWLRKKGLSHQRIFKRQQQRALRKRKRYDSVGSFSVNLLTYRSVHASSTSSSVAVSSSSSSSLVTQPAALQQPPLKDAESNRSRTATIATATGSYDDQNSYDDSYNAEYPFKSHNNEEGMEPIDEQTEVTME
jgi:hypothetical protein